MLISKGDKMRITDDVRNAIERAAYKHGSNTEFGAAIGIHGSTVGKWRNRIIQSIEDDIWDKVLPHIQEFMPNYTGPSTAPHAPHPCDGHDRPPELKKLCEVWHRLTERQRKHLLLQIVYELDGLAESEGTTTKQKAS